MTSTPTLLIDPPSPFAPMKELQDFLDRNEGRRKPHPLARQQVRQALAFQRANSDLFPAKEDRTAS